MVVVVVVVVVVLVLWGCGDSCGGSWFHSGSCCQVEGAHSRVTVCRRCTANVVRQRQTWDLLVVRDPTPPPPTRPEVATRVEEALRVRAAYVERSARQEKKEALVL